jgi:hypothetical protein
MGNGYSRDRIPWGQTLELFLREVRALGATEWVLMVDVTERDIRLDGQLRADARPASPVVAVAIESPSRGPLLFACGRFDHWQDNARAIALGLEALRKVDRYGITQAAEQYTGFRALPPGVPMPEAKMTVEDAAQFLIEQSEAQDLTPEELVAHPAIVQSLYRRAAMLCHPDAGGLDETFRKLTEARDLLMEGMDR